MIVKLFSGRTTGPAVLLALLLLVPGGGTAEAQTVSSPARQNAQQPNFVLIIADDMGWDDTAAYGHPTVRTPHLERLAREGMRFDQAFVTTSSCSPSRASLITGRYPHSTGAARLHQPLPAEQITFVELLRNAGYWTAAAGKWHLGSAIRDRFDVVKEAGRRRPGADAPPPAAGDINGAEEWIETMRERPKDKPFFLWLASIDPHRPYRPGATSQPHRPEDVVVPPYLPDTPEVRADLALYYDEVARLDSYVGQVLGELERQGVADNTFVLFISDNGRPFPRAKTSVYDSGIRTPFILRWPGRVQPGSISSELVSTVDLAPTLLELAGVQRPSTFQGSSFASLLTREPGRRARDYIFAEKNWHDFDDRVRATRSERYKYIRNDYRDISNSPPADAIRSPTFQTMRRLRDAGTLTPEQRTVFVTPRPAEELYDLWEDPHELRDLAGDPRYAETLSKLRGVLDAWQRDTNDLPPATRTPDGFDRETGEALPRAGLLPLDLPRQRSGPDTLVAFKRFGDTELRLHLFFPPGHQNGNPQPALVLFFGGGWYGGEPGQFYPQARYFASRGLVAIAAEYRTSNTHGTSPFESVRDARSAMRWVRTHAAELGVDPQRIAAGGGSAGGHLAAAAALLPGIDEAGEDLSVSSRPDALVLFNPVIDNGPGGYGYERIGERYPEFSPLHNVAPSAPPTIVFLGTEDNAVPVQTIRRFEERMRGAGARVEVRLYEGQKHGFFNYGNGENEYYFRTVREADRFLSSLGYLQGHPTL